MDHGDGLWQGQPGRKGRARQNGLHEPGHPGQTLQGLDHNKKQITRLHDLTEDPWEQTNLINSGEEAHKKAIKKFQQVLDTFPDRDARPLYEPRAANPWDINARKGKKKES